MGKKVTAVEIVTFPQDRKDEGGEILFLSIGQGHGYFFSFLSSLKRGITSSSTSFSSSSIIPIIRLSFN